MLTFRAPDFWAWHTGLVEFDFELEANAVEPSPLARIDLAEADRLRNLRQFYEEQVAHPHENLSLAADARLQLARIYEQLDIVLKKKILTQIGSISQIEPI